MAEALLRHHLDALGVEAKVSSAGEFRSGLPAADGSIRTMAARGLDLGGHRSRTVAYEHLAEADLVVAMARRHVRQAVITAPEVWPRTFTLKELVRRGEAVGPRPAGQPLQDWLARIHLGRQTTDLVGDHPDDDIEDPIGAPDRVYEAVAAEIEDLVLRLVAVAFAGHVPSVDAPVAKEA